MPIFHKNFVFCRYFVWIGAQLSFFYVLYAKTYVFVQEIKK